MSKAKDQQLSSSFRDPDGFLYKKGSKVYRQVNKSYQPNYDLLMDGLYQDLVDNALLVPHKETKAEQVSSGGYKVLEPEQIPFISYPYEWSFGQYKDAALTTLEIQRRSLNFDMSLKDASSYNIQFHNGRPLFIDTLSFEQYEEGKPWVAYKQFCQHFLAPLTLMAKVDIDLSKLMRVYIDGIPITLASRLLPKKTWASSLAAHIHFHARAQQKYASDSGKAKVTKISKSSQLALITSLANVVQKLELPNANTEWGDYYTFTNYSDKSFNAKKKIIAQFIKDIKPTSAWDVGANNGLFSRIASEMGVPTIAFDIDPIAVEKNYRLLKRQKENNILPLVMDLTNPSPSLGWSNEERDSFIERGPADLVMSLALIHHLAISNNLPLPKLADFFASISKYLVMEFVPKGDSQVNILLATRKDIFPDYNEEGFEAAFLKRFEIISRNKVVGSKRTLYLLKRR